MRPLSVPQSANIRTALLAGTDVQQRDLVTKLSSETWATWKLYLCLKGQLVFVTRRFCNARTQDQSSDAFWRPLVGPAAAVS